MITVGPGSSRSTLSRIIICVLTCVFLAPIFGCDLSDNALSKSAPIIFDDDSRGGSPLILVVMDDMPF